MNSSVVSPRFVATLFALAAAPAAVFAQGALLPAGAPAPSMKTLAQIESRTDVATLPGDATAIRVITQPGSYYLTGDVVGVAGKGGIRIEANNVTLDLNGFAVTGPGAGSLSGIYCPPEGDGTPMFRTIAIRNGVVASWGGRGVSSGVSIDFVVSDVRIRDCGGYGIQLAGGFCLVENCMVEAVTGEGITIGGSGGLDSIIRGCIVVGVSAPASRAIGISAGYGIVEHCRVRAVAGVGATGIFSGFKTGKAVACDVSQISTGTAGEKAIGIDAPLIADCNISDITGSGSASGYGIYATHPSLVTGTRVHDIAGLNALGIYGYYALDAFGANGAVAVQGCDVSNINAGTGAAGGIFARAVRDSQVSAVQGSVAGNTSTGIFTYSGGLVSRCTVMNVEGHGIELTNPASAVGNSVSVAGKDGSGAGIYAVAGCRIEGNRVSNSVVGIQQVGSAVVIGNSAQGNTTNYSGVDAALIVNSYATMAASGSAFMNVSF